MADKRQPTTLLNDYVYKNNVKLYAMNLEKIPIALILATAILLCTIPLQMYDIPLSWEGFYHVRIAENILQKQYLYDTGSFGPDGRIQVYPPVFHFFSALLMKFINPDTVVRWVPPFMLCAIIVVWYLFAAYYYKKSIALLSSLFLLTVPAFVDLGFLFSPQSFSLILIFAGFLFFEKNPFITGILGGFILMTHFTAAFYFFIVLLVWSFLTHNRAGLKVLGISVGIASVYLIYFVYHFPAVEPVLGIPSLKYVISKTTLALPALALLGVRKDLCAAALSAGAVLAFVQPTNFCYIAFPLVLFSAFFVHDFFLHRKWAVIALLFIFWVLLIPSHQYVSKLQPAASEYESFVWLNQNSVSGTIASGWYQAPIIAAVADRTPVLGFSFPDENRVADMDQLYSGDTTLLDLYDISYVYFGAHEEYDYQTVALNLDKVYTGKGDFYKREPPLIYVLITADIEYDLPPVLSSYNGIKEGLPYLTNVLDTYQVKATFFVLGETAHVYPEQIKALAQSHQIGCHSMYHQDMRKLSFTEKKAAVQKATRILQELAGDITAFRAPGHSCDTELITILIDNGYTVEASACSQFSYPYYPSKENWLCPGDLPLLRVPISHTPSYFYPPLVYPRSWVDAYTAALKIQNSRVKIIVVGVHPWEFVELHVPGYEQYTRACGEYTRTEFEHFIKMLHKRRVTFLTMSQLYDLWEFIEEKWTHE